MLVSLNALARLALILVAFIAIVASDAARADEPARPAPAAPTCTAHPGAHLEFKLEHRAWRPDGTVTTTARPIARDEVVKTLKKAVGHGSEPSYHVDENGELRFGVQGVAAFDATKDAELVRAVEQWNNASLPSASRTRMMDPNPDRIIVTEVPEQKVTN